MAVVIFLVGPTGIGKTAIALQIAKQLDVEIVSADSRQIYKFLSIGTAKPSENDLNAVPHYFINLIEPDVPYSAGQFGREARDVIDQIMQRAKIPLVVGGAGFYIQALISGLSEIGVNAIAIRAQLRERWAQGESDILYEELKLVDPPLAATLQKKDKQRVLRALEVYLASQQRLSDLQKNKATPAGFEPLMFGLIADRQILYQRINTRVDEMLARGLIDEVNGLKMQGFSKELNALNTVGYKEVFDYLEDKITYEEMVTEIKKNSRRYAKRQLTWFRRDERIRWIDIGKTASAEQVASQIIDGYRQA